MSSPPFHGLDSAHRRHGEVHVIVGPMFAGKTTALLRRVIAEANTGRSFSILPSLFLLNLLIYVNAASFSLGKKLILFPPLCLISKTGKLQRLVFSNLKLVG